MKRTPLKPISKQKALDNVKYRAAKEEWREKRIKIDGYHQCEFVGKPYASIAAFEYMEHPHDDEGRCIFHAMPAPHHKKGRRGSLLWNQRYFMCVCFFHHRFIEDNKREARKRSYILYK